MNTRRRWLAAGAAWPALAWTGALRAQANPPVVVGMLSSSPRGRGTDLFIEGMAALGWKLGAHYVLEERYADGRAQLLPALAQELAEKKPAVIVARPSSAARAAAAAAPATAIVLFDGDPVSSGLVTSLARPGGMITGLSNVSAETDLKSIDLLMEAMPKLQRIGFLADSTVRAHAAKVRDVRRATERLRVDAVIVDMATPEDIAPALAQLAKAKVQALVILSSAWFGPHYPKIMEPALAQRWPVAGAARQGGLFSFGANLRDAPRRAAHYVDRILKGAKPGDLAIEQPTTFDLIVNLKTAKALGITMPKSFMLRATEVIE